jgi:hypothetical protein
MDGRCTICRRSLKTVEKRYLTSKGVFEFNHIDPAQKSAIYEKLIRRVVSTEQFDELDKCNLLCRICHGVWTNQRLEGKALLTLELNDGRIIKKKFGMHGMVEIKNGQLHPHLFPDNPQHIEPYAYALGTGRQFFRAGFELEKQLAKLMLATRRRRFLRVWDQQGLVFQVARVDRERMHYEQLVRFALLKFAGRSNEKSPPHFWVRSGKAIIRGRGVKQKGCVNGVMEYAAIERGVASDDIRAPILRLIAPTRGCRVWLTAQPLTLVFRASSVGARSTLHDRNPCCLCLVAFVIVEEQKSKFFAHVPLDVRGQHAEEYAGANSIV